MKCFVRNSITCATLGARVNNPFYLPSISLTVVHWRVLVGFLKSHRGSPPVLPSRAGPRSETHFLFKNQYFFSCFGFGTPKNLLKPLKNQHFWFWCPKKPSKTNKKSTFLLLVPTWSLLVPTWSPLVPTWSPLCPIWSPFGPHLISFGSHLVPIWSHLVPT